jgi:hypothetical protein
MTQINKYFIIIKNFIKFVAELAVDVVRFVIDRIRNKENTNKEMSNNTNKPKPFYQERNSHGYPTESYKANSK